MVSTSVRKQAMGALLGIAAAVLLYVSLGQVSDLGIRGELVSTASSSVATENTVSSTPTYDMKHAVPATQEDRIAVRTARFSAAGSASSVDPNLVAGVTTYTVPAPQTVIQRVEVPVDREVIKEVPVIKEVIKEVPVIKEVVKEVPVVKEVVREVPVVKEVVKEIPVYRTLHTPTPTKGPLTQSGPGLLIVAGTSALAAFGAIRRKRVGR